MEAGPNPNWDALVVTLASRLHEDWRVLRQREDRTFEPRYKTTTDKKWIQEHNTDQVDIANTPFENPPSDWQTENLAAAKVVIGLIREAVENNTPLDAKFVESASAIVHTKWLERNGDWAEEHQKVSFDELSPEEQEKDRQQVRAGITVYETARK